MWLLLCVELNYEHSFFLFPVFYSECSLWKIPFDVVIKYKLKNRNFFHLELQHVHTHKHILK